MNFQNQQNFFYLTFKHVKITFYELFILSSGSYLDFIQITKLYCIFLCHEYSLAMKFYIATY